MEIADKQKSQDEHIQRLQAQMIEDNKRQQKKMEEVLEKCLKDQAALMKQGFREKAIVMEEKITDLKRRLNEREESSGGILSKITEVVLPFVKPALSWVFPGRKT